MKVSNFPEQGDELLLEEKKRRCGEAVEEECGVCAVVVDGMGKDRIKPGTREING